VAISDLGALSQIWANLQSGAIMLAAIPVVLLLKHVTKSGRLKIKKSYAYFVRSALVTNCMVSGQDVDSKLRLLTGIITVSISCLLDCSHKQHLIRFLY
jgi:hypothetical protein